MEHLGAEVGQLGSFLKAYDLDAQRFRADPRIAGHDSVYIRPDLNCLGVKRPADERASKIGSSAAKCCCNSFFVRRDETAHHGHLALVDMRAKLLGCALLDNGILR